MIVFIYACVCRLSRSCRRSRHCVQVSCKYQGRVPKLISHSSRMSCESSHCNRGSTNQKILYASQRIAHIILQVSYFLHSEWTTNTDYCLWPWSLKSANQYLNYYRTENPVSRIANFISSLIQDWHSLTVNFIDLMLDFLCTQTQWIPRW